MSVPFNSYSLQPHSSSKHPPPLYSPPKQRPATTLPPFPVRSSAPATAPCGRTRFSSCLSIDLHHAPRIRQSRYSIQKSARNGSPYFYPIPLNADRARVLRVRWCIRGTAASAQQQRARSTISVYALKARVRTAPKGWYREVKKENGWMKKGQRDRSGNAKRQGERVGEGKRGEWGKGTRNVTAWWVTWRAARKWEGREGKGREGKGREGKGRKDVRATRSDEMADGVHTAPVRALIMRYGDVACLGGQEKRRWTQEWEGMGNKGKKERHAHADS
ncbi:hypothetical protein C8R45DRAFT_1165714 [Mycena sanguinolenta]|nr:hypothetical protein C8R45DRAFT_1165714 [Mycena sanguinolenta]